MRRPFGIQIVRCTLIMAAIGVAASSGIAAGAQGYFPESVASGDPTPGSVVLWTRVDDPARSGDDLAVTLEVATDSEFSDIVLSRMVTAGAEYDHCIKVLADGLEAATTYFYRFSYDAATGTELSPMGRTRTAPDPEADVPVKFAVVYGQDFAGRYYNAYAKLIRDHPDDLDFVVHLGDYVYETTADPSFQAPTAGREVVFQDTAGAIALGDPANPYYAAASLANYRTLYRTFRSDPMLQRVHELYPMVVIWDDHEYSNDCHGDVATYFNGREDEADPVRRRHAEQAFFEYIPIAAGLGADGTLDITADDLYPNSRIYRELRFGKNLDLVLTDYRTFRPDHLIPENGFPGTIVVDQETLQQMLGSAAFEAVAPRLDPYVNIERLGLTILKQTAILIAAQAYQMENPALDPTQALGTAMMVVRGEVSATYINLLFQAAGLPAPFSEAQMATFPHGVSYLFLGKRDLYGSTGSRYIVMHDAYRLLAGALYAASQGQSENALGADQEAWIWGALDASPATWNVLASSVSMAPMVLDLTNPAIDAMLPPEMPDVFRTRIMINADQWDGFPNKRSEITGRLASPGNTVIISGDIHGSFVTDHGGVYEFTGPAISSETLNDMVLGAVSGDPILGSVPGLDQLVANLALLLHISAQNDDVSPSDLAFVNSSTNGYAIMEAKSDELDATYFGARKPLTAAVTARR